MIYMISDSELQIFANASKLNCLDISPLSDIIDSNKISLGKTFAEKANGLKELGLFEKDAIEKLTTEGLLMASVLMQPDCVVSFGRKNTTDRVFYALKKSQIWYIYTYLENKKLCIVYAYMSTAMLSKWIDEQVIGNYTPSVSSDDKFNTSLSYKEWYAFLISQFIFIRREQKHTVGSDWFSLDDIDDEDTLKLVRNKLIYLNMRTQNETLSALFNEFDRSELIAALSGLHNKGLVEAKKLSDGTPAIKYTQLCIDWLDNHLIADTVFLNVKYPGSSHTTIFSLRLNGILAMSDNGHEVHLRSVADIPWNMYLK